MADLLERIIAAKFQEVEAAKAKLPEDELTERAASVTSGRAFAAALRTGSSGGRLAVIAEAKRASPSAGAIVANYDPAATARGYEAAGASCLSVLTDREFFAGEPEHLKAARSSCSLPTLRKDFIVDRWQVFETKAMGADCMLLIAAALEANVLAQFHDLARSIGLEVLIEVHSQKELDAALATGCELLGINNRDLATLETELATTETLAPQIGALAEDAVVVSESAIATPADAKRVRDAGASAILVGEALLRESNPSALLRSLIDCAAA